MINIIVIICLIYIKTAITDNDEANTAHDDDIRAHGHSVWCKLQPNGYMCNKKAFVSRYYYDTLLQDCKSANFGFCKYNDMNAYSSLSECHAKCRDVGEHPIPENLTKNVYCRLQSDFGYCNSYHPMFYYDLTERECRGFSYSGCGGNQNRFQTHQLCAATCASIIY